MLREGQPRGKKTRNWQGLHHEQFEQIEPNGHISDPSKTLESSHLTEDTSGQSKDQTADDEAEVSLGELRNTLSVTENEDTDVEEQLESLEYVDPVTHDGAINAESDIAVGFEWVTIGIEVKEHDP